MHTLPGIGARRGQPRSSTVDGCSRPAAVRRGSVRQAALRLCLREPFTTRWYYRLSSAGKFRGAYSTNMQLVCLAGAFFIGGHTCAVQAACSRARRTAGRHIYGAQPSSASGKSAGPGRAATFKHGPAACTSSGTASARRPRQPHACEGLVGPGRTNASGGLFRGT